MRKTAIVMLMFLIGCVKAQRIQNFYVFAAANSVGIRFTITQGPQCNGYTIYHSTDSINFIPIEDYVGVCGDQTRSVEYSFTHSAPAINQVNYYKVSIFPQETSPVARIFVSETLRSRILPFPNPVFNSYDLLGLKIYNVSNIRLTGFIFNQFGKSVRSVDFKTVGDIGYLPVNDLDNGMYIIWVNDGEMVYSTKFIIQR